MDAPEHPGTIVYVDGDSGQVIEEVAADTIPESMRFATNDRGHRVPITRVEISADGDERHIVEYGADGTMLRSTTQLSAS